MKVERRKRYTSKATLKENGNERRPQIQLNRKVCMETKVKKQNKFTRIVQSGDG